jgi:YcxB-like protein
MILSYLLTEYDFLQHQLFVSSKSERIKKLRTKSLILVSSILFILSILFFQSKNNFLAYSFLAYGVINIFLYPLYLKNHYKKHYQKFIQENYKNRFGKLSTLTLNNDSIECFDTTGNLKINLSEIEVINETGEYFYLSLKSGGNIIIPKVTSEDIDILRTGLQQITDRLKIKLNSELNWKWK